MISNHGAELPAGSRAFGNVCLPTLVFREINICIVCFDVYKNSFFRVSLTGSTKRVPSELEVLLKLRLVTTVVVVVL